MLDTPLDNPKDNKYNNNVNKKEGDNYACKILEKNWIININNSMCI